MIIMDITATTGTTTTIPCSCGGTACAYVCQRHGFDYQGNYRRYTVIVSNIEPPHFLDKPKKPQQHLKFIQEQERKKMKGRPR